MDKDLALNIVECVQKYPKIELFMLFGSRARSDANQHSDWDFGYVAKSDFDPIELHTELILLLGTDHVDLVNLSRANGQLRYRVAKDGKKLYEKQKGAYETFWVQAVDFWCDAGPIIRAEYEALFRRIA